MISYPNCDPSSYTQIYKSMLELLVFALQKVRKEQEARRQQQEDDQRSEEQARQEEQQQDDRRNEEQTSQEEHRVEAEAELVHVHQQQVILQTIDAVTEIEMDFIEVELIEVQEVQGSPQFVLKGGDFLIEGGDFGDETAALVAANLCESLGVKRADGKTVYRGEGYTIEAISTDAGRAYQIFSEDREKILDFVVDDNGLHITQSGLSLEQKNEFTSVGEFLASSQGLELLSNRKTIAHAKELGQLAPVGTAAALNTQRFLDEFEMDSFEPVAGDKEPFVLNRTQDGISILDKQTGQEILSVQNGVLIANLTDRHLEDFEQIFNPKIQKQSKESPPIVAEAGNGIQLSGARQGQRQVIEETLTAYELTEWLVSLEAAGASYEEMSEVLAVASDARNRHPELFNNQAKGRETQPIVVRIPADLAAKRTTDVEKLRTMEKDFGTEGVKQIIAAQKSNRTRITDPKTQIQATQDNKIGLKQKKSPDLAVTQGSSDRDKSAPVQQRNRGGR